MARATDREGLLPPLRQKTTAGGRRRSAALAPFAAIITVLAGLVFLILLPICGVASLLAAAAQWAWDAARASRHAAHRTPPRGIRP